MGCTSYGKIQEISVNMYASNLMIRNKETSSSREKSVLSLGLSGAGKVLKKINLNICMNVYIMLQSLPQEFFTFE